MKKVAAAIIEQDGKVLIAQRPKGDQLAFKWEFPGGKIEPGETPGACLVREIKEELNLDIKITRHFTNSHYQYATGAVELICFLAKISGGKLRQNFHANVIWVAKEDLKNYNFAPADIPVVTMLGKTGDAW